MIYGSMPMMIFILAAGYLFTVYLLLALAKRTDRKTVLTSVPLSTEDKKKHQNSVRTTMTEAVNSQ